MRHWPDKEEALLNEFLDQLGYSPENLWAYRSMPRHFQRFASKRKQPLAEQTLQSWLKTCAPESKLDYVINRATFVKRFLDWLVERQIVVRNPFTELRERYECRSTAAIVRALLDPQPENALEALRPPPRYASHLGSIIGEHVQRMRTLGYRYPHEDWFIRFDRYLQQRPVAGTESFAVLARAYAASRYIGGGQATTLARNQGCGEGSPTRGRSRDGTRDGSAPHARGRTKADSSLYILHDGSRQTS